MNSVLQHGFYYSLETDPKISEWLLQKHPPSSQQRTICERLDLPTVVWSFYIYKKVPFHYIFKGYMHDILDEDGYVDDQIEDDKLIARGRYLRFSDMVLSDEEKFFISHRWEINRHRKYGFCIQFPIQSLQNLCINNVIDKSNRDPRINVYLQSKYFASRLEYNRTLPLLNPMPKYNRRRMRSQFYDACYPLNNLFSEIDAYIFSEEFVIWFQNDPLIYKRFKPNSPFKIIHFNFSRLQGEKINERYNLCMKCMKWYMYRFRNKWAWERRYYTPTIYKRYTYDNDIQSSANWCVECKRVPLFHVLSMEDYETQYDYKNIYSNKLAIKVELFL